MDNMTYIHRFHSQNSWRPRARLLLAAGDYLAVSIRLKSNIALYLDQLSLALTLMITFVCGLIHLYSIGYMAGDPGHVRYFALLNLFVFAMLLGVLLIWAAISKLANVQEFYGGLIAYRLPLANVLLRATAVLLGRDPGHPPDPVLGREGRDQRPALALPQRAEPLRSEERAAAVPRVGPELRAARAHRRLRDPLGAVDATPAAARRRAGPDEEG